MLAGFILALLSSGEWEDRGGSVLLSLFSALPTHLSRNGSMSYDMSCEGRTRLPQPRLLTLWQPSSMTSFCPFFPKVESIRETTYLPSSSPPVISEFIFTTTLKTEIP